MKVILGLVGSVLLTRVFVQCAPKASNQQSLDALKALPVDFQNQSIVPSQFTESLSQFIGTGASYTGLAAFNLLSVLLFIVTASLISLFERKVLALTQRRVGPNKVGYKGRLQFLADALKVFFKEYRQVNNTQNKLVSGFPVVLLTINLVFAYLIVWGPSTQPLEAEYHILITILIFSVSHIVTFFTGFSIRNNFTVLATQRLLNLVYISELFTTLVLTSLIWYSQHTNLSATTTLGTRIWKTTAVLLLIASLFFVFLVENGKVPFDVVEAETEVIMGYHTEYSGFLFAVFVLAEYIHCFVLIYLIGTVIGLIFF